MVVSVDAGMCACVHVCMHACMCVVCVRMRACVRCVCAHAFMCAVCVRMRACVWCVCARACTCRLCRGGTLSCVGMCGGQKLMSGIVFNCFSSELFEAGSLTHSLFD